MVTKSKNKGVKKGSTGPRTPRGKARSKLNSLKFGLYAKAAVLSYESEAEFQQFCLGIRRDLFAAGMLEEALADKIATNLWRQRRLLVAEGAAIEENIDLQKDDDAGLSRSALDSHWASEERRALADRRGHIRWADSDPESLEICLDKLERVIEYIDAYGLECETIALNLGLIYGARFKGRTSNDLFDLYIESVGGLKSALAKDAATGSSAALDIQQRFIAAAQKELTRLEGLRKGEPPDRLSAIYEEGPTTDRQRQFVVPTATQLDCLLRYDTHLSRELIRAFDALERMQAASDHGRMIEMSFGKTGK